MQHDNLNISLDYIEEGLSLEIKSKTRNSLFNIKDAEENGEAPNQIVEGKFYYYKFSKKNYSFESFDIIDPSPFNSSEGRIAPNIFTGTLILLVLRNSYEEAGNIALEVQSLKSSYREDYRFMLESITEKCTDLLLQANAPATHNFEADFSKDSETLYQRFAFIKSIINSDEFKESIHRIITSPSTAWTEELENTDSRKIRRFKSSEVKQLTNRTPRIKLPAKHPLSSSKFDSFPTRILTTIKTDTNDTPENRFIKHALETYLKFCNEIETLVDKNSRIYKEVVAITESLESQLNHSFFQDISRPHTLKLNSPILQRKEGYREVLKSWLMFDLAAKLIWKGGEDVYQGNKRDVATLYEYWLFFTLLEMLSEIFDIESKEISQLIQETKDGLGLQLKQGRHTALAGVFDNGGRKLRIKFSFNRTFSGNNNYPNGGSWTKSMRPDYTLSIWPEGITEAQAEKEELIVHIHFDAKYRIEKLNEIIDTGKKEKDKEEEEITTEKKEENKGKYKNGDLLKMHAYKDAIRRTGGAYVLYPGTVPLTEQGFHELIPGLGAFPLRPTKTDNGTTELKAFILDVLEHFLNRASHREKLAFRIFDIHKNKPNNLDEQIPEAYGPNRGFIPDDIIVLIVYYKKENIQWIKRNGLINVRTGIERGSLRIGPNESGAKYLLLHTEGEIITSKLFKISESGPRIFSKKDLINKGYPTEPSKDFYLVYKFKPLTEKEFQDRKWNISKLNAYKKGRGSALPFAATLTELMQAIEPKI